MHGLTWCVKLRVLHGLLPCAPQTRDLPCHFFSPNSLSAPGLTYSCGTDAGGARFPSQPRALARGGRGADARSPPAPLSPAGLPAAPTCFALNGAGAAGGLFRPRPRAVAGGGSADAPYTAGPGSPGPGPGAPSLGTAGPGPRRARRPNMGTAGAAFLGAGRCRRPP